MKIAKEKVWQDAEGNLVPDGDESASILVAAKGQEMRDSEVAAFKNADKFFVDGKVGDTHVVEKHGSATVHKKKSNS